MECCSLMMHSHLVYHLLIKVEIMMILIETLSVIILKYLTTFRDRQLKYGYRPNVAGVPLGIPTPTFKVWHWRHGV